MFVMTLDEFETPSFAGKLAMLDQVLTADLFARVAGEVNALVETGRSYLPTHKKGETVAYSVLREKAPTLVSHYRSANMCRLVSRIVRAKVQPSPLHDERSCSVLFYERPGDHINWHYDHNFYRRRHFTVLIPAVNRGREGGLFGSPPAGQAGWARCGSGNTAQPAHPL